MPAVSILSGPLLWTSELSDTPEQFTLGLDVQECAEVKHALTQFQGKIAEHILGSSWTVR